MPLIPFPDVPQVPGVPAVLRGATLPSLSELANLGLGALTDWLFGTPRWGIYDENGQIAIQFDSFLGIRFRNFARISSFPIELGTFASINKVDTPYDATIRVGHSGDMTSRAEFFARLDEIKDSTAMFSVVTPEIVYPTANLVGYAYDRSSRTGPSQLIVDLYFEDVRQTVGNVPVTAMPDGAPAQSNGQVQAFPLPDGPRAAENLELKVIYNLQ